MLVSGQTICLNMIVKDEAPVIRRCLDSVLPFIDHWVIIDTGSNDGTQQIIKEHLSDIPGALHERPWKNFAENRSEALELAQGKGDYLLIIDADDVLDTVPSYIIPHVLTADAYTFEIADNGVVYRRTQLVRCGLPWRYAGVLHEFITCETAKPAVPMPVFRMPRYHDGARQRDPDTYRRDATLLEDALKTEADPFLAARYRFYLAQSYYDCRQWEKALAHYQHRATLGFWQEEIFISLYRAAQLMERLKYSRQEIVTTYLRATQAQSGRAEALYDLSKFCRMSGLYEQGFHFAEQALKIKQPADGLYVESWIYEVGILDEYAANAYWCGRYKESLDANLKILATGKLPPSNIQRTVANARHAQAALGPSLRNQVGEVPQRLTATLATADQRGFPIQSRIMEEMKAHSQTLEWLHGDEGISRLGVVIPYRNREVHLKQLLPHLISYFQRESEGRKIKPLIVVSEQIDTMQFNRGWCRNAGALAVGGFCDYFCFHDVDYLPLWADYSYSAMPARLVRWGTDGHRIRPETDNPLCLTMPMDYFSGVIVVDKGQYLAANGYSNQYYGWGYEDGDFRTRLRVLGFRTIVRDGTFTPLAHDSEGFTAKGAPSVESLRNKELFDRLSEGYRREKRFQEGVGNLPLLSASVDFERWRGLDNSESMLICRLKVSQEPAAQAHTITGTKLPKGTEAADVVSGEPG